MRFCDVMSVLAIPGLLFGCAINTHEENKIGPDRNITIVATDLVSAFIQIKALKPSTTTLQFSNPVTPFGHILLRTFEDAGYGVQISARDDGKHYVKYASRSSETESGEVLDYFITVDNIEVRREYKTTESGIYPTSLLYIKGVDKSAKFALDNSIFYEQGGDEVFLSGVKPELKRSLAPGDVREVVADHTTYVKIDKRTNPQVIFKRIKHALSQKEKAIEPSSLAGLSQYKRVVIIFPVKTSLNIGRGNKIAIRQLLTDFQNSDIFDITACDDFDGRNDQAEERAEKIRDEFVRSGVQPTAIRRAPCVKTNFRHQSDDSPVPVRIVQYRVISPDRVLTESKH